MRPRCRCFHHRGNHPGDDECEVLGCGCPMFVTAEALDMDMNMVILCGSLAAPAELRQFSSGSELLRFLVTTRTEQPKRRVDVVSVTWWEPGVNEPMRTAPRGTRVWVQGQIQRRFWSKDNGRESRLEVVANEVVVDGPWEGTE